MGPNRAKRKHECDKYVKTIPQARKNLTGPKWAGPWHDWDIRLQEIQAKLRRHRFMLQRIAS